ncbi:hypothetical protein [Nocardioides bigeumensis]
MVGAITGLVVVFAPLVLLAPVNGAAPARADHATHAKPGTLKVRVVKPAHNKRATVVVRGPNGFRKEVHSTTKLTGLEPGRYRISGSTVRTKAWYSKPEISRRVVRVKPRTTSRATVSYWTVVSTRTKVLTAKDIDDYRAPEAIAGSRGLLVLDTRMPDRSILAAGITPQTPAGALVEVVSSKRAGKSWSHVVKLSSIETAVPRGSFDESWTFTPPATGGPAGFAGVSGAAITCSGSFDGGADIDGGAEFAAEFGAKWDWGSSYVSAKLSADAWVTLAAWADAKGTCGTGDLTVVNTDLAYIAFAIGPIPVVLVPHLDVSLGATVQAQGHLRMDAGASAHAAAIAKVGLKGGSITGEGPTFDGSSSFDAYAAASAEAYAKARLSMLLYKVAGPWMQARMGAKANADTRANPWWTVDGFLEAGAGVTVGGCLDLWIKKWCLKVEKGAPDLLKGSFRITQASGTYPPTYPVKAALGGPHVGIPDVVAESFKIGKFFTIQDDLHITTGRADELAGVVSEPASVDVPGQEGPNDRVHDANVVTVTVVPEYNRLRIPYVFGTEEAPGSGQDGAQVKVGGTNCALIGGHEVSADDATISNADQHLTTRYNWVTPVQVCDVQVVPHQPVKVELIVYDTWNGSTDSGLAVVGDHISSYQQ